MEAVPGSCIKVSSMPKWSLMADEIQRLQLVELLQQRSPGSTSLASTHDAEGTDAKSVAADADVDTTSIL